MVFQLLVRVIDDFVLNGAPIVIQRGGVYLEFDFLFEWCSLLFGGGVLDVRLRLDATVSRVIR